MVLLEFSFSNRRAEHVIVFKKVQSRAFLLSVVCQPSKMEVPRRLGRTVKRKSIFIFLLLILGISFSCCVILLCASFLQLFDFLY